MKERVDLVPGRDRKHPWSTQHAAIGIAANLAMITGGGLIAWSAGIHLKLWGSGYRSIETIGTLFLLQAIVGFVLAVLVVTLRRLVPALLAIGFLTSTICGLVISAEVGLFGFKDSFSAPNAGQSLLVEGAGIAVLIVASILRIRSRRVELDPSAD